MIRLGDVAIMGGGCYGSFYLGQLQAARARHAVEYRRVLVVDHNAECQAAGHVDGIVSTVEVMPWTAFLDSWLDRPARAVAAGDDMLVPTPLMPHLMATWLERRARREWPDRAVALVPVTEPLGTPYDRLHADGVRYVSFADWLCPTHCVEPLLCPAIRAPRTWEMSQAITDWTGRRPTAGARTAPALFACRHVAFGVGMYPARTAIDAFDAFRTVADVQASELVIGSISSCHGALAVLRVGAPAERRPIFAES